jgi:hypothetical protein
VAIYRHANWLTGRKPSLLVDESMVEKGLLDEVVASFVVVENLRMERSHS